MDSPAKRNPAKAKKMPKKRGAYPKSGARCVRRLAVTPDSLTMKEPVCIKVDKIIARTFDFYNCQNSELPDGSIIMQWF